MQAFAKQVIRRESSGFVENILFVYQGGHD